jgi:Primase X
MGEKLEGAHPTVLWSGNGYHIYQPMKAEFPLEQNETFSKFNQPSIQFLRFAEQYLSNNKSDPSHNPSIKSCMIRIPGSFNSKCILADGYNNQYTQVKILQRWNGYRPKINLLLGSYYAYLVDLEITESQSQKYPLNTMAGCTTTLWIEKLLRTPIADYRKNAVSLILAPYLINIKMLSYDDALNVINNWLMECGKLRRLDNDLSYIVKYALKSSIKSGRKPLKFDTLKLKNAALYDALNS